jgi:brefeldin A-resistance guanine nucleotide exchange factor 1
MSSSGYLVPPSQNPAHKKLWLETWKRLDRFLPELRKELDIDEPEDKGQPSKAQQSSITVAETTAS